MATLVPSQTNAWQRFREQETNPAAALATREFLNAINHKLSQPLTAFRCCIELAMLKQEVGDKTREQLGKALEQSDRAHNMLHAFQELLDSALEHRESNRFDLSAVVLKTMQEFSPVAAESGILLVLGPLPAFYVQADYQRVNRAVRILFDHSLACVAGGEALAISAGGEGAGQALRLHIASYLSTDELFDPFVSSHGPNGPVSNLSAVVAQNTFRSGGGDMRVNQSQPGRCIEIWLPAARPAD